MKQSEFVVCHDFKGRFGRFCGHTTTEVSRDGFVKMTAWCLRGPEQHWDFHRDPVKRLSLAFARAWGWRPR